MSIDNWFSVVIMKKTSCTNTNLNSHLESSYFTWVFDVVFELKREYIFASYKNHIKYATETKI